MEERRDYHKNGIGWHQDYRRRGYDKNAMDSFCLHCDLRQEVDSKVSIKIFSIIISIFLAVMAAAASMNGIFIKSMVEAQKETLTAVGGVSERTAKIEARQEIIMSRVIDIDNK